MMETKKPDPPRMDQASVDGPVYRLRVQHVTSDGRMLEPGTLVGAGQEEPWDQPPTNQMEGVNDQARKAINEVHQRLYGVDAPWHDPKVGASIADDLRVQEEQRREAADAAPVSHQQAVEQDKKWEGRPHPFVQARIAGVAPPPPQTFSGVPGGPGVATPNVDASNPRPIKPLEEELPKS
jgi:hypothetical protein